MKKVSFAYWFFPLVVFLFYVQIFVLILTNNDPELAYIMVISSWLYGISDLLGILYGLIIIIGVPGLAIKAVLYSIYVLTEHKGDSYVENGYDYLEVTVSNNTITAEEKEGTSITSVGILRVFMFFTYLIWCIPAYIIYNIVRVKKTIKNDSYFMNESQKEKHP